MLRPFEEDPLFAPNSVDTEEEFEEWVEKHKEPVMMKLTLENYFNVWVSGSSKYFHVNFLERPRGRRENDSGLR